MYKGNKIFCDVCGIETKYEGCVLWYEEEYHLCKSHYLKYCKYKPKLELKKKYKDTKPCTKLWNKMCKEQENVFKEWFKAQKSTTPKKAEHNTRFKKERVLDKK